MAGRHLKTSLTRISDTIDRRQGNSRGKLSMRLEEEILHKEPTLLYCLVISRNIMMR